MVLDARGELVSHLGGHKRVGDVVLLKVLIQGNQVQTQFLGYDKDGRAAGQSGIHVHHACIKAVTGISSHIVFGLEVVIALVPVAEGHEVGMRQLATFGYTC